MNKQNGVYISFIYIYAYMNNNYFIFNQNLVVLSWIKLSLLLRRLAIWSKVKLFPLTSFIEFDMIWIGTKFELDPRTPTNISFSIVQDPPITATWWKSCSFTLEASRVIKAIPGFFEISRTDELNGREGSTDLRIFSNNKFE